MIRKTLRDKRGFVFILLAGFLLLALCAIAGLALDVGKAYVVKTELQNAADASALAGAGNLYNTATNPPTLVWATAQTEATNFIGKNKADGKVLTDCTVATGYWNVAGPANQTLQPTTITPGTCAGSGAACSSNADCNGGMEACIFTKVPAVKVTVNKAPGVNDGPVQTVFAKVIGWTQFQPRAMALAYSGFPGSSPRGTTFPFAVTECLKEDFLNHRGLFAGGNSPIDLTGKIGTTQGDMLAGQWTNLSGDTNTSAATVSSFIQYLADPRDRQGAASPPVQTGEVINVAAGVMTSAYRQTQLFINRSGGNVFMPVVQCGMDPTAPPATMTVKGFVEMKLICANCLCDGSPSNGKMCGQFVGFSEAPPGAGPGGSASNTIIPPKMVQ